MVSTSWKVAKNETYFDVMYTIGKMSINAFILYKNTGT